jgi:hypothetical protein
MTISNPQYDIFSETYRSRDIESDVGDAESIIDLDFFPASTNISPTKLRVNINGTFVVGTMKRWDGSQWVNCLNTWDGTQWASVI